MLYLSASIHLSIYLSVNSVAIKLYLWHCRTAVPLLRVSFKEIQTGPWSFALIIFHLLRPLVTYIRRYIAGEWRTKWLAATRWSRHWLVWRTVENFIENTSKITFICVCAARPSECHGSGRPANRRGYHDHVMTLPPSKPITETLTINIAVIAGIRQH